MVPAEFLFLTRFPRTANGKVDRRGLLAQATAARDVGLGGAVPRDALECTIAEAFGRVLGKKELSRDAHFFNLGGHSLMAVRLLAELGEILGKTLPISDFLQVPTVMGVASRVRDAQPKPSPLEEAASQGTSSRIKGGQQVRLAGTPDGKSKARPWVELRSGQGKPVFLVHEVQGLAEAYRGLVGRLKTRRPMLAFQSPGLVGECVPLESISDMAAAYTEAVLQVQPRGPYTLVGWSMGGLIALEMAQRLKRRRRRIARLVMIDTHSPDIIRQGAYKVEPILRALTRELGLSLEEVTLDEAVDPLEQIWQRARLQGGGSEGLRDEEKEVCLAPYRVAIANREAIRNYFPEPYAGAVDLIRAVAFSGNRRRRPRRLGWEKLVTGPLKVIPIDGDHHSIVLGDEAADLAEILDQLWGS